MRARDTSGRFTATPPRLCPCGKPCKRLRAICETCRADPAVRATATWKAARMLQEKRIDEAAEKETRRLSRETAFTPLDGEAIVLKWMRNEDW